MIENVDVYIVQVWFFLFCILAAITQNYISHNS